MTGRAGVHLLFFLSGICGLVYQVVWVRQLGVVFGSTVYSAAVVTAIFMSGLGIGSYLAGRLADRRYEREPESVLRAYGLFEIGIGLLGLLIAVAIPALEPVLSHYAAYTPDANGWHHLSPGSQATRYALATVLLFPPTALMGGTLTLLIRYLIRRDMTATAWKVGTLYGVNTAGAALGAFAVDFFLVPTLGLLATQSTAVVLNLGVGLVAMRWASARGATPLSTADAPRAHLPEPTPAPARTRRLVLLTGAAVLLSGFAAMGMEILWFRVLTTMLWSHRATFSLLLTVILVGLLLGSLAGGAAHRRFGRPALLFGLAQAAFAVTSVLTLLLVDHPSLLRSDLIPSYLASGELGRRVIEVWAQLREILPVVIVPAFFMGFSFPLANANIQRAEATVGARAGILYLANTVGAVAGSLVTGFVLLPHLGTHWSVFVLVACAAAPLLPLAATLEPPRDRGVRHRRALLAMLAACVATTVILAVWGSLPTYTIARRIHAPVDGKERLLAFSEGINETIVITEHPDTGERRLYTNGYSMTATRYSAQRYMRAFVHLPLLQMEDPRSVLVICFGVGNTLHAASLHSSVERLEIAELSQHILEHARYFGRWNHGVLRDPRVQVFVDDGRQHLRMQPEESYDLVTLEPPPIGQAGVSALYSKEFYELVRSRLRDGGELSQWLPAYQAPGPIVASIVRAFVDVFPDSVLLSGYGNELIMVGRKGGPITVDPDRLAARLAAEPLVRADLEAIDLATPTELVGMVAGSASSMRRIAQDAAPVTDDLPSMEYGAITFQETVIPEALFDLGGVRGFCPRCFEGGAPRPIVGGLDAYLAILGSLYASIDFRATLLGPRPAPPPLLVRGDREALTKVFAASPYLRRVVRQGFIPVP